MTTPPLPPNHEPVTPEFIRKHGAQKGLKANFIQAIGKWLEWTGPLTGMETSVYIFSAPIGTTAAATTPVRELSCNCPFGDELETMDDFENHEFYCNKHPRNRRVHILPWELAELDEKPEGFEFANSINQEWTAAELWPGQTWNEWVWNDAGDFAYSVPLHVYERIQAGRDGKDLKTRPDNEQTSAEDVAADMELAAELSADTVNPTPSLAPELIRHEACHCPCCGELNSLSFGRNDEYEDEVFVDKDLQYQIICDVHDGGCGTSSGFYYDPAEAAKAWNRRASLNVSLRKILVSTKAPENVPSAPPVAATPSDGEMLDRLEDQSKTYWVEVRSQPSGRIIYAGKGKGLRAAMTSAMERKL